jgi:hypothetical protein
MQNLTQEQIDILRDLVNLRATTPMRFEINTSRIGQNLKQKFEELETLGFVRSEGLTTVTEEMIYTPTLATIRFITHLDKKPELDINRLMIFIIGGAFIGGLIGQPVFLFISLVVSGILAVTSQKSPDNS